MGWCGVGWRGGVGVCLPGKCVGSGECLEHGGGESKERKERKERRGAWRREYPQLVAVG